MKLRDGSSLLSSTEQSLDSPTSAPSQERTKKSSSQRAGSPESRGNSPQEEARPRERVVKEIRKLLRSDSRSIGDEEYNDLFNDPQQRKKFDIEQLNEQMKSISNLGEFTLYNNA